MLMGKSMRPKSARILEVEGTAELHPELERGSKKNLNQKLSRKSLPLVFIGLAAAALLITGAWIGLLGYGVWWLLDWMVG